MRRRTAWKVLLTYNYYKSFHYGPMLCRVAKNKRIRHLQNKAKVLVLNMHRTNYDHFDIKNVKRLMLINKDFFDCFRLTPEGIKFVCD